MTFYKHGVISDIDMATYNMIDRTDMSFIHDYDCDQPPYNALLEWYRDATTGEGTTTAQLKVIHVKYMDAIRQVSRALPTRE